MGDYTEEQVARMDKIINDLNESTKAQKKSLKESSEAHKKYLKDFSQGIKESTRTMKKKKPLWLRMLQGVGRGISAAVSGILHFLFGMDLVSAFIVWFVILPVGGILLYQTSKWFPDFSAGTAGFLLSMMNFVIPLIGGVVVGVVGWRFGRRFIRYIFSTRKENALIRSTHKAGWDALHARRDALIVEWSKYETDISLMIDYPIMTDYTDPEVRKVVTAMQGIRKAEMMSVDQSTEAHDSALQDAVDEFEVSFRAAERYARRYGQDRLSAKEQQKLATARTALDIILDEESPSFEVEAAYKSLRSSLKGIIDVPQQAIAAIEARVRRELQAL